MLILASQRKVIIGKEQLMFREAMEAKCLINFRLRNRVKTALFIIRNAFQDTVAPFALRVRKALIKPIILLALAYHVRMPLTGDTTHKLRSAHLFAHTNAFLFWNPQIPIRTA
jgi:hypothetical protein